MKMVLTFEGHDIESMSREELMNVVRFLASDNERLNRENARLHRDQVETFRKIASMRAAV